MPFRLRWRRIPILYYHEVGPERSKHVVHPDDFAAQLAWLADAGFTPLSIDALCDVLEGTKPEPARPILLTFDDGRAGVHRHAAPALARHGFPATLYAVTDWLDGRGIPDAERYSAFLGWDELASLRAAGFTIGSHTLSHRTLKKLPAAEQVREVVESRTRLEQGLGAPVVHFSFPKGRSTGTARRAAHAAGYRSAVVTGQRYVGRIARLHDLGRLRVDGREDLAAFRRCVAPPRTGVAGGHGGLLVAGALAAGAAGAAGAATPAGSVVDAPASAERARGVDAAPPPGPSVESRLLEIQRRVQAAVVYPPAAQRRGVEGEAQIELVLGADGIPREVRTRASSGSPLLDRAAERAIRDAGALPYVYGVLVVPVRFTLDAPE